jgi:hypothetical protein
MAKYVSKLLGEININETEAEDYEYGFIKFNDKYSISINGIPFSSCDTERIQTYFNIIDKYHEIKNRIVEVIESNFIENEIFKKRFVNSFELLEEDDRMGVKQLDSSNIKEFIEKLEITQFTFSTESNKIKFMIFLRLESGLTFPFDLCIQLDEEINVIECTFKDIF